MHENILSTMDWSSMETASVEEIGYVYLDAMQASMNQYCPLVNQIRVGSVGGSSSKISDAKSNANMPR